jgi:hypothetical protein
MNNICYDTPDLEGGSLCDRKWRILVILWYQHELAMALREAFDGQSAVDDGNDNAAISGRECTVYNQHIAGVDSSFTHRLPSHPDEKGRRRMLDEMLIEVEGAIEVIIGWGGISG